MNSDFTKKLLNAQFDSSDSKGLYKKLVNSTLTTNFILKTNQRNTNTNTNTNTNNTNNFNSLNSNFNLISQSQSQNQSQSEEKKLIIPTKTLNLKLSSNQKMVNLLSTKKNVSEKFNKMKQKFICQFDDALKKDHINKVSTSFINPTDIEHQINQIHITEPNKGFKRNSPSRNTNNSTNTNIPETNTSISNSNLINKFTNFNLNEFKSNKFNSLNNNNINTNKTINTNNFTNNIDIYKRSETPSQNLIRTKYSLGTYKKMLDKGYNNVNNVNNISNASNVSNVSKDNNISNNDISHEYKLTHFKSYSNYGVNGIGNGKVNGNNGIGVINRNGSNGMSSNMIGHSKGNSNENVIGNMNVNKNQPKIDNYLRTFESNSSKLSHNF